MKSILFDNPGYKYQFHLATNKTYGKTVCMYFYSVQFVFVYFFFFFFSRQIANGLWPTTWSNLLGAVVVIAALLYAADFYKLSSLKPFTAVIWKVTYLLNLDEKYPYNLRLLFISVLAGVVFFIILLYLRQYLLRMLLAYRGWMCK